MAEWILACKELNGVIYVARLPQSISASTPGIPDTSSGGPWFVVGPGTQPSVQPYNGTDWILTFNYLSHLFTRVIPDINATWPPAEVEPITTPVPYPGGAWEIELPADALNFNIVSNTSFGLVQSYYNPPTLQNPLLFFNPFTDTYSITLTLTAGYAPQAPASQPPFYQLWYRAIGSPTWLLLQNWVAAGSAPTYAFSYNFQSVGSLLYEFSLIWGSPFNPTDQWNSDDFEGGVVGMTYITVDSNTEEPSYQLFTSDSLTLDLASTDSFGVFGERGLFLVQSVSDDIQLSMSLIGQGTEAFASFGVRAAFIFEAVSDAPDEIMYPFMGRVVAGTNNYVASSSAFCHIG